MLRFDDNVVVAASWRAGRCFIVFIACLRAYSMKGHYSVHPPESGATPQAWLEEKDPADEKAFLSPAPEFVTLVCPLLGGEATTFMLSKTS